ncbi:phosphopantetheine-binding protein [Kitasatospora sp. HPMI-4]|uniref:phosphopantetheine-binding protein n=1 Tax=Kitasatospora sp. HPMI-4 TaxID=3448443 RepID=UPI003F1AD9E7
MTTINHAGQPQVPSGNSESPEHNSPRPDLASQAEVQRTVLRIWEDVLRLDGLNPDDNFLELGGHSLAASQIISRMREALHTEVPLAAVFDHPTIAELTAFVLRQRPPAKGTH